MIETSSAYESGSDDDDELFVIRSVNVEPMLEIVCILGVQMKFQVDSGSAVTAISECTYKEYFNSVPLSVTNKRLLSYTGERISCLGVVRRPFTYPNKIHTNGVRHTWWRSAAPRQRFYFCVKFRNLSYQC